MKKIIKYLEPFGIHPIVFIVWVVMMAMIIGGVYLGNWILGY